MESNSADWFNAFYAASDNGTAHEEYTTFYTQDAKLMMGDKTAVGQTGTLILTSRATVSQTMQKF